jgi:hypothetical protein
LGFIGILLLLCINLLGFYFAVQAQDWRGIALMLFMSGLLVFFARALWRGKQLSQGNLSAGPLAEGWAGRPVGEFFREQVAKSIEGGIFLTGASGSLLLALLLLLSPVSIGVQPAKSGGLVGLFAMWPVLSFALYLRVCGPGYETTLAKVIATVCIAAFPFYIAYR